MSSDTTLNTPWSFPKRLAFLFLATYFSLSILEALAEQFLSAIVPALTIGYFNFWNWTIPWTAAHLLHINYPSTSHPNGSGDTSYNYVLILCHLLLALVISISWTVLDRKRPGYQRLYHWLRIGIRYFLVYILIMYGAAKVFQMQFPFPSLYRMTVPLGQMSPMGLAWTFVGYSPGYNIFLGGAEIVAGLLLLFRRTTLLGAILSAIVMINVAAMNLAYDIPVKLFSTHLAILSLFLAAHDSRRLRTLFFQRQPRRVTKKGLRIAALIIKIIAAVWLVYLPLADGFNFKIDRYSPLYGVYQIDTFYRNRQLVPPLMTDGSRWKKLIFDSRKRASLIMMTDSVYFYGYTVDTITHNIKFAPRETTDTSMMTYERRQKNQLVLQWNTGRDSIVMIARRIDTAGFPLQQRGFHWINEYPYNH